MDEWTLVRSVGLRLGAMGPGVRCALDAWANQHAEWIGLGETRDWASARDAFLRDTAPRAPAPVLRVADAIARALSLGGFEADLLRLVVAADRCARFSGLLRAGIARASDLPIVLAEAAGAPAHEGERAVRRSAIVRLGLARFATRRDGETGVCIGWALGRVLDDGEMNEMGIVEVLVGPYRPARLSVDAFSHVADLDLLVRLLRGAVTARAHGVNVLIYGPPGTGKTELAATLAQAAQTPLYAVGEADEDGDEPSRWDRIAALLLALRLAGAGKCILLFDEFEDVVGDAKPSGGDWMSAREGSKVFVNRLLETNPAPIIWTTNAIGNVDEAILRRMSFILHLKIPPPDAARRMLSRIAAEEAAPQDGTLGALLARAPDATAVLRVATRAARLAEASDGGTRVAGALLNALHGRDLDDEAEGTLDLDLFESEPPIRPLLERLATRDAGDVSFLVCGPPGTGKTSLARSLAQAMDRPLTVKRASDLLSPWIGGTEKMIAAAFREARERGHVLFFDEVDSLLFDRADASRSWETSQVNEMLTWLDRHPGPVIAATNHVRRLDPAALRRFVFKITLAPLGRDRAARAFSQNFGLPAPAVLAEVGNLTPGDFAAVSRQLRHAPARSATDIVERLRAEAAWRPEGRRIGF